MAAMYLRGLTAEFIATDPDGDPIAGAVGTVHAKIGGPEFSNTFACDTATLEVGADTNGTVLSDSIGRFAFYTEDYAGPLWLYAGGRWWQIPESGIDAILAAQLAPLLARISALEAGGAGGLAVEIVTEAPEPGSEADDTLYLVVPE